MSNENNITIGDTVRLKSGGVIMTVIGEKDDGRLSVAFGSSDSIEYGAFHVDVLRHAPLAEEFSALDMADQRDQCDLMACDTLKVMGRTFALTLAAALRCTVEASDKGAM